MEKKSIASHIILPVLLLLVHTATAQQTGKALKTPLGITPQQLKSSGQVFIVTNRSFFIKGQLQKASNGLYLYTADPKQIDIDSLLQSPDVVFIQPVRKAKEEMVINGSDLSLNAVFYAQDKYPLLTGKGLTVSVKENLPDTADIDFRNRYTSTNLESAILSSHATIMSTLIAGAGNTYYTGKGVAYKAGLTNVSFQILLPEHDSVYKKYHTSVQNHSYGTGIENYYGADSWAYDISVKNNDSLLHVFSAGNSGTQTSTAGKYAGIPGFANITGSFKQSKNSLSVAATDSFYNVELPSSKGPAYDGRLKPELTAFGQDGSSGAAALVSGTALLIQDAYKQKTGNLSSASLVKATLINAADDILQPGPDFKSGYGSLNTERSIRQVINNRFFSGTVTNANIQQFNISVPVNTKELKVTLAWNDVAAAINAPKALVNDLDLEVEETGSGIIYYPFVLSHFPHVDSLNAIAVRKKDTLNNVEQVTISLPAAGNYIIRVKGSNVQGAQSFDVVYNTEAANVFQFTYPTKSDNLYPGTANTIRWNSTVGIASPGTLQISYDGINWATLSSSLDLSVRYFKTIVKDTVAIARFRMTFGSTTIISDSFTISPRLNVNVGYKCPDSFQLYWNKLKNVPAYNIYGLTDTFMRPLFNTTDTSIVIAANTIRHYAVGPVIGNKTGLRSYAFNYTTQGVGCFINSFLGDVFDDTTVQLKAILGSTYSIKEISFQRLYPLTTLATFPVNKDTFTINDILLKSGLYYYRVKLLFDNGKEVFSDIITVRIFQDKPFFVYPNPYRNGGKIVIQSKTADNGSFELFNTSGQKVYTNRLMFNTEEFFLPPLQSGVYFYRIMQNNKQVFSGKLLVH
jgi:hypothetical protein